MGAYYIYHNCMNFLLNEKFYSFFYMLSSHTDSSLVCAINKRWVPWYCYYMYASSLAKCLRSAPFLYMYQYSRGEGRIVDPRLAKMVVTYSILLWNIHLKFIQSFTQCTFSAIKMFSIRCGHFFFGGGDTYSSRQKHLKRLVMF